MTGTLMARNVPVALESLGGIVAPGISQRIALAECRNGPSVDW